MEYNFTNGNPRLGKWLAADLGLRIEVFQSLVLFSFYILLPPIVTTNLEEAAFCDICKDIFSTIEG